MLKKSEVKPGGIFEINYANMNCCALKELLGCIKQQSPTPKKTG
jgi:hypothetical protein